VQCCSAANTSGLRVLCFIGWLQQVRVPQTWLTHR
jgi:hypothetical protein